MLVRTVRASFFPARPESEHIPWTVGPASLSGLQGRFDGARSRRVAKLAASPTCCLYQILNGPGDWRKSLILLLELNGIEPSTLLNEMVGYGLTCPHHGRPRQTIFQVGMPMTVRLQT